MRRVVLIDSNLAHSSFLVTETNLYSMVLYLFIFYLVLKKMENVPWQLKYYYSIYNAVICHWHDCNCIIRTTIKTFECSIFLDMIIL